MKFKILLFSMALAMLASEILAREYSPVDSLQQALSSAESDVEKATINYALASALYSTPKDAAPYISAAYTYAVEAGNVELIAKSGYVFGLIFSQINRTKDAFLGYHHGLEAYIELGDNALAAQCHLGIARLYLTADQVDKAEEHIKTAGSYLASESESKRGSFYRELADLYASKQDFESAFAYYDLSLQAFEDPLPIALVELRLGNAYRYAFQFEEAEEAYGRSLVAAEQAGVLNEYARMVDFNLAMIQQDLGNHLGAIDLFKSSLEYEQEAFTKQWTINALSSSYIEMGEYAEASALLSQSIAFGRDETGLPLPYIESFELAIVAEESLGNIEGAFLYQKELQSHLVSKYEIDDQVSDTRAVYEVQMAENEILSEDLAVANQNIIIAISVASVLALIILAFILVRIAQRHKALRGKFNRKQAAIRELKRMAVSDEW